MADAAPERSLILETSHRVARIALAHGERVIAESALDEARRHGRDLAPTVKEMLAAQGWPARSIKAVVVSRGPGSYTGLRVGLISAKTFAYATGCALLAIDTFLAIGRQRPGFPRICDIIADAQKDKIYVQRFIWHADGQTQTIAPLEIRTFADWCAGASYGMIALGPGLEKYQARLPEGVLATAPETWYATPQSLLDVALERWRRGERDDPFAVEPLYLRPSSAEEQWKALRRD